MGKPSHGFHAILLAMEDVKPQPQPQQPQTLKAPPPTSLEPKASLLRPGAWCSFQLQGTRLGVPENKRLNSQSFWGFSFEFKVRESLRF